MNGNNIQASSQNVRVFQNTVKNPMQCSGVGLHTGRFVTITLKPAAENTGIAFIRTDVDKGNALVKADFRNVVDTTLGTSIANESGVRVATIEHLMAALWGCGIDNAIIEIDGPEVPIMDGSSEPFVFLIECAGILEQSELRKFVKILRPVEAEDKGAYLTALPDDSFSVTLEIDFNNKVVSKQKNSVDFTISSFKNSLSRARTFGFEHEVSHLRSKGLALGGSLNNAIVVGEDKILNTGGLRYSDEFVRHKILDCVGDLYLAGFELIGKVVGSRSGHCLNVKLLKEIFADEDNYRIVTADIDCGIPYIETSETYAAA